MPKQKVDLKSGVKFHADVVWINSDYKGTPFVDKNKKSFKKVVISEGRDAPKYTFIAYGGEPELEIEKGSNIVIDTWTDEEKKYLNFCLHKTEIERLRGELIRSERYCDSLRAKIKELESPKKTDEEPEDEPEIG